MTEHTEDSPFWREIAWRLAAAPDAGPTDAYLAGSFVGLARLLHEEHASTRALELVVSLAHLARAHVEAARGGELPPMLRMVTIEAPRRCPHGVAPVAGGLVLAGVCPKCDGADDELERQLRRARELVASLEEQVEALGAVPVARLEELAPSRPSPAPSRRRVWESGQPLPSYVPPRECNGGPSGPWCGRPATSVSRGAEGECFTCDEHRGADWTPIDVWFARLRGGGQA